MTRYDKQARTPRGMWFWPKQLQACTRYAFDALFAAKSARSFHHLEKPLQRMQPASAAEVEIVAGGHHRIKEIVDDNSPQDPADEGMAEG